MDILSIAILIFIIMESANVAILYFWPGSQIGNGVGVFNAFHNSESEEQKLFASYNIVTVIDTAASRVYFHLKAEAVRMRE